MPESNKINQKRLLTVAEAAKVLGLKESRLRKAFARRELPFNRIGRLVRFDSIQLNEWIKKHTIKCDPKIELNKPNEKKGENNDTLV